MVPKDYVPPLVEGMYRLDKKHPEGVVFVYVGYCDWEKNFDKCLREFVLTVFHEVMHILFPKLGDHIPFMEQILAEILDGK
jgi:hypothetical protein